MITGEDLSLGNIEEIGVVGYPGMIGGATTELDHQIDCWIKMGLKVHLCYPYAIMDVNCWKMKMIQRGCIVHKPRDWKSLDGVHVISFCNKAFLEDIRSIKKYARTTTFVNCMTWNFPEEIEAQKEGLIDMHLYQTEEQFDKVSLALRNTSNYRAMKFSPYFREKDFSELKKKNNDTFKIGRISRGSPEKYGNDQFYIYENIKSPIPKKGIILGWEKKVQEKYKDPPSAWIKCYKQREITQQEFYENCDVLVMQTETTENLPRVGMEAMASKTLLIVDNRGGWTDLVEHGKTGWLCDNKEDFIKYASRSAYNVEERENMNEAALKKLRNTWGMEVSMRSWDKVFKKMKEIR